MNWRILHKLNTQGIDVLIISLLAYWELLQFSQEAMYESKNDYRHTARFIQTHYWIHFLLFWAKRLHFISRSGQALKISKNYYLFTAKKLSPLYSKFVELTLNNFVTCTGKQDKYLYFHIINSTRWLVDYNHQLKACTTSNTGYSIKVHYILSI